MNRQALMASAIINHLISKVDDQLAMQITGFNQQELAELREGKISDNSKDTLILNLLAKGVFYPSIDDKIANHNSAIIQPELEQEQRISLAGY